MSQYVPICPHKLDQKSPVFSIGLKLGKKKPRLTTGKECGGGRNRTADTGIFRTLSYTDYQGLTAVSDQKMTRR